MDTPTIYNYRCWVDLTEPEALRPLFSAILKESHYTVLDFVEHHFSPQGYTCIWLLAESHLAIHTFPEAHKTYVELSGCNKANNALFESTIKQHPRLSCDA